MHQSKKIFIIFSILIAAWIVPLFAQHSISFKDNIGITTKLSTYRDNYVLGEIIVKFKENKINLNANNRISKVHTFANARGMQIKEYMTKKNIAVFTIDTNKSIEQQIAELYNHPDVEYAQPNFIYTLNTYYPNDPGFYLQRGLYNTGQTILGVIGTSGADIQRLQAMQIWSGDGNVLTTGTLVAIIDDGLQYNHPDLTGQLRDGSNCVSYMGNPLGNCLFGYDFYDMDKDPLPVINNNHGTHIAGIIGAKTNNTIGIAGTHPGVKIMGLRVASGQTLTTLDATKAIAFAQYNGAKIINASRGGSSGTCSAIHDTILYNAIKDFPGLFVTAAGNNGKKHLDEWFVFPADFNTNTACWSGLNNIITVAASTNTDTLASFSDFGTTINIAAPGKSILSTYSENQYAYMDGTSMATPYVVGVASLARNFRPDLSYIEIKNILLATAKYIPVLSGYVAGGKRLNVYATLHELDNYPPLSPELLSPSSGSDMVSGNIHFLWTESVDKGVGLSGYFFQLSTGYDFVDILTGMYVFATGYDITLSETGIYYRRVYAFDKKNNTGNRSDIYMFSITYTPDTTPPPIPIGIVPSLSSSYPRGNVSFVWTTSVDTGVGTMGYIYEVLSGAMIISGTTTTTGVTIDLESGEYSRKVKAYDNNFNYSDYSDTLSFSVLWDTSPHTIVLSNISSAEPNVLYTSNIVTLSGINTGIVIAVNTGLYNLNSGGRTGVATTGYAGDTIQLILTSSVDFSTGKSMILIYGDKEEIFTVTTRAKKTTPIGLSFTTVNNTELQTLYTSNTLTVAGLETGYVFTASITAGELIKNGTNIVALSTGVENGDVLAIRLTSSSAYSTSVSSLLTLGSGSATYTITTKSAPLPPSGGGGGGGGGGFIPPSVPTCTSIDLICSGGIYILKEGVNCIGGNLGLTCTTLIEDITDTQKTTLIGSIIGSPFTKELNDAYLYAYSVGITTMPTIQQANLMGTLIRKHLAKMISNFAMQTLGLMPNAAEICLFGDMSSEDIEMKYYAKLACQLGLMGLDTQGIPTSTFNPNEDVTRAQFGTVLSRALRGNTYNGGVPYYKTHLNALQTAQIMTKIDTPENKELRGWVMLMLMRTIN